MPANKNAVKVSFSDKMVLIGLGFAAAYWIIDTFLYILFSYELNFFQRLMGPDLSAMAGRLIVLCLFIMFGAHAQFTINQRNEAFRELKACRERLQQLGVDPPQ